jgi:hypothetical protein
MSEEKRNHDSRNQPTVGQPERRQFIKPRLERRSKLPKVTNGLSGTFEP